MGSPGAYATASSKRQGPERKISAALSGRSSMVICRPAAVSSVVGDVKMSDEPERMRIAIHDPLQGEDDLRQNLDLVDDDGPKASADKARRVRTSSSVM